MSTVTSFYNLNKEGGVYYCNKCLREQKDPNSDEYKHHFKWSSLRVIPVGYKGNYIIGFNCEKCNSLIKVPEKIIPKCKLFKLKCRLPF